MSAHHERGRHESDHGRDRNPAGSCAQQSPLPRGRVSGVLHLRTRTAMKRPQIARRAEPGNARATVRRCWCSSPSETKLDGGDGPPLRLDGLSHPELTPLRGVLRRRARGALGRRRRRPCRARPLPQQDGEIERNAAAVALADLPGAAPLHRRPLRRARRGLAARAAAGRARARLAVGSALFGLLRADDPVPAYRLSAGSALPGRRHARRDLATRAGARAGGGRRAGAGGRPALGLVHGVGQGPGRGDGHRLHGAAHGREPLQQGAQGQARAAVGEQPGRADRCRFGRGRRTPGAACTSSGAGPRWRSSSRRADRERQFGCGLRRGAGSVSRVEPGVRRIEEVCGVSIAVVDGCRPILAPPA